MLSPHGGRTSATPFHPGGNAYFPGKPAASPRCPEIPVLGLSATQIGTIVFSTLFGSALVTLWAGLAGQRIGRRRLLLGACALMMATGLGFIYLRSFWSLLAVAFVGTLNPSAGDVSVFLPLEQAALAETVLTRRPVDAHRWYRV